MSLKAVLWDLDGVITDTGEFHYQAWVQIFTPLGIPFSRITFKEIFGMNNATTLSRFFDPNREAGRIREISERKEALFRELARGQMQLLPGVLSWLTYFKAQGIRQAVASSAPSANIDPMIAELGIGQYFDALVSGAKIAGKPDPGVFLLAAKTLGVKPADCLVIEDSVAGIEAAVRAGMCSVAVQTTNPAEVLKKASLVVNRLSDLAPAQVESRLWPTTGRLVGAQAD